MSDRGGRRPQPIEWRSELRTISVEQSFRRGVVRVFCRGRDRAAVVRCTMSLAALYRAPFTAGRQRRTDEVAWYTASAHPAHTSRLPSALRLPGLSGGEAISTGCRGVGAPSLTPAWLVQRVRRPGLTRPRHRRCPTLSQTQRLLPAHARARSGEEVYEVCPFEARASCDEHALSAQRYCTAASVAEFHGI